jgi:hypothetical protein
MLAEFYRQDAPAEVVGRARLSGPGVELDVIDEAIRDALERVYRLTPVSAEDPALRTAGTTGPVVLHPGGLPWFIHASRARAGKEGLASRLVAEDPADVGGWDPAAAYRTFSQTVERRARMSSPTGR